jgi:hypothetical protein
MKELRRLRDETKSPLGRTLLASADDDRSASGARDRALAILGLGAAGGATAGVVNVVATAKQGSGVLATAKTAAAVAIKWIGVGLLGGAVTLGAIEYAERRPPPTPLASSSSAGGATSVASPQARPATRPLSATSSAEARPTLAASAGAPPSTRLDRSSSETPPARATSSSRAVAAPPQGETATSPAAAPLRREHAAPDDPIDAQLAALNAVRDALAAHDPTRALFLLEGFRTRHPSSPLAEEVEVLRIDALSDAGRKSEATSSADAFLKTHPESAYREHIRTKSNAR